MDARRVPAVRELGHPELRKATMFPVTGLRYVSVALCRLPVCDASLEHRFPKRRPNGSEVNIRKNPYAIREFAYEIEEAISRRIARDISLSKKLFSNI